MKAIMIVSRLFHSLFSALWMYCALISTAYAIEIVSLSYVSGEEEEQLLIEMDDVYPPKAVFTLDNPPRVVIDLPAVDNPNALSAPDVGKSKLIKGVRFGQYDATTMRIVLDAKSAAIATHSLEPSANRLVVSISPKQGAYATKAAKRSIRDGKIVTSKDVKKSVYEALEGIVMPEPKPKREQRKPLVVIDAGHGGKDTGAIGPKGLKEKDLTMRYAKALKKALEDSEEFRVKLTRQDDRYLLLNERIEVARGYDGDLFLSLHADANPSPRARGFSIYTLSEEASDDEAAALAKQENKADILSGMDLSVEDEDVANILIDLAQRETNNKSSELAETIIDHMPKTIRGTTNTHRFAGFRVLKAPDIPSVLIEIGFLTNRHDEKLLQTEWYQQEFVKGLVAGLKAFR